MKIFNGSMKKGFYMKIFNGSMKKGFTFMLQVSW